MASEVDDQYEWRINGQNGSGIFSTSETWRALFPCTLEVYWHDVQEIGWQHLFFDCEFSERVWSFFTTRLHLSSPRVFEDRLRWLKVPTRDMNVKLIVRLIYQACVYLIWKERNSRVHTDTARPPEAIISEIKQTIRLRLDPLARAQVLGIGESSVLAVWLSIF
ncbi:uncharacterized protein LOC103833496 [Brassica rapa]|uniref:uncharacterized protein LOC106358779 n=1 Tax=Brassica napus TaxID=3708 RepID=UPI0004F15EDE|nr:uncharacterized protein LOC106358779 [Brassica napus]XP_033133940.1 uncharacterized protein LOC103833496 [Brassica rapa]